MLFDVGQREVCFFLFSVGTNKEEQETLRKLNNCKFIVNVIFFKKDLELTNFIIFIAWGVIMIRYI